MAMESSGSWARTANLVLGIWLFISAFIWPHSGAEQTNTWILGILIVLASIAAMYAPPARYLNTVFGIYLFVSSWLMPHVNAGTLWNNLIVAVLVFVVSLIPSTSTRSFHRPAHA